MKIGMIFECGPQGADKQVCEYLTSSLRPGVSVSAVTLDNKENLLRDAGKAAVELLADGCCCVLIVWDLRPSWPDMKLKPCRSVECAAVLASLRSSGVPATAPVHLICIEQELESWLLANERAIEAYLSSAAHPFKLRATKKPDSVLQPKAAMINHFEKARGWRYDDKVNAIKVIKAVPLDLQRLRRSDSFARFEQKVLGC